MFTEWNSSPTTDAAAITLGGRKLMDRVRGTHTSYRYTDSYCYCITAAESHLTCHTKHRGAEPASATKTIFNEKGDE